MLFDATRRGVVWRVAARHGHGQEPILLDVIWSG